MAGCTTIEYSFRGRYKEGFVDDVSSKSAGEGLAALLKPYTNAGISRVMFTETQWTNIAEENSEEFQDLSVYVLLLFRAPDGSLVRLGIPAPKISLFDQGPKGYTLKREHGDALAVTVGAAINVTLKYESASVMTMPN